MRIEKISINQIAPATYNPRKDLQPGDKEYDKLKKSIHEFGYIEPLVWNKQTGNLVGGHQRFKVLLDQGCAEVEVSVVDLSLEKEKTLNIALNKINGAWDDEKLAVLLEELATEFEVLDLTGFDEDEVNQLIEDFRNIPENELGDFVNKEFELNDFSENNFEHKCPRCGYVFDEVI